MYYRLFIFRKVFKQRFSMNYIFIVKVTLQNLLIICDVYHLKQHALHLRDNK